MVLCVLTRSPSPRQQQLTGILHLLCSDLGLDWETRCFIYRVICEVAAILAVCASTRALELTSLATSQARFNLEYRREETDDGARSAGRGSQSRVRLPLCEPRSSPWQRLTSCRFGCQRPSGRPTTLGSEARSKLPARSCEASGDCWGSTSAPRARASSSTKDPRSSARLYLTSGRLSLATATPSSGPSSPEARSSLDPP